MPINVYLITNPRMRPSRTEQVFIDVLYETVAAILPDRRTYPLDDDDNPAGADTVSGERVGAAKHNRLTEIYGVAEEPVLGEPVSGSNSLPTGK